MCTFVAAGAIPNDWAEGAHAEEKPRALALQAIGGILVHGQPPSDSFGDTKHLLFHQLCADM